MKKQSPEESLLYIINNKGMCVNVNCRNCPVYNICDDDNDSQYDTYKKAIHIAIELFIITEDQAFDLLL